jgi:hypothetical protein
MQIIITNFWGSFRNSADITHTCSPGSLPLKLDACQLFYEKYIFFFCLDVPLETQTSQADLRRPLWSLMKTENCLIIIIIIHVLNFTAFHEFDTVVS